MLLKNSETCILKTPYHDNDVENYIIKNCLFDDYEKFKPEINKSIMFMVVKNTGFIIVKISKNYFDLLGGIKSDKSKNAIEKTTKLILEYCKKFNLTFRVQTDVKKIADKYMKIKGFKCIEKMPLYLLYNKGV